jgi:hypothetical protein
MAGDEPLYGGQSKRACVRSVACVDWILRGKPCILREDWVADFGGFVGKFGLVVGFLGLVLGLM